MELSPSDYAKLLSTIHIVGAAMMKTLNISSTTEYIECLKNEK